MCISCGFLFCKAGVREASSAQVEFARVSVLLYSFASLCPHTAPVRKAVLKMRLDNVE